MALGKCNLTACEIICESIRANPLCHKHETLCTTRTASLSLFCDMNSDSVNMCELLHVDSFGTYLAPFWSEVNPHLKNHLAQLVDPKASVAGGMGPRVLVPLCGKTVESWLPQLQIVEQDRKECMNMYELIL